MQIAGKKVRLVKWIHGSRCVLRVEVDGVIPDADPSEPVVLPDSVRWLDELQRLADLGDMDALQRSAPVATVYVRKSA
ncbi:hypothetical protein LBMAG48_30190 [Phycisphaerae bacterium]|jgi:hypothetical protein|nr:hypothetical protein LBMAG48_30190 [Phycisphaerae bacterium]